MNLDWRRLLRTEREDVFGLDIGSSAVKLIQLRKDNAGYAVTAAGKVDITDVSEDSDKHREVSIVKAIRDCLQSAGIQTNLSVCSVCGSEVAVRCFKFPSLPPEEVGGAVMLEAEQICPFNINDAVIDYQLIPACPPYRVPRTEFNRRDGENNAGGVFVAATNKLIKTKSQLAKDALLNNVLMDVDGLALLNCFNKCEKLEAGHATAILNVGSSFANLAIISDDNLPFIRDIACAGNDIIKQIAAENNVPTETVSGILRKESQGLSGSAGGERREPKLKLADCLAKACQKLIVDINETLRYYTAQNKSALIEKIFVCGGFALVEEFVQLMDNQLSVDAVLWNPFDKIANKSGHQSEDILRKSGPAMAVAAGLAMRSI